MAKEFDREKLPIAIITAMAPLAQLVGTHRVVVAVSIPHPTGDPHLPPDQDRALRKDIVRTALQALQTEVTEPTIFHPRGVSSTFAS